MLPPSPFPGVFCLFFSFSLQYFFVVAQQSSFQRQPLASSPLHTAPDWLFEVLSVFVNWYPHT